ncbi:hypothetical protein ABW19_dt0201733 [Dactylella cylindrospora]|nr:hypothetical protein ABW19_dt0201733 [Dactylella cylindrospora]
MSSLLLLPREIRDMIYSYLYTDCQYPSTSPDIYAFPTTRVHCFLTEKHVINYPLTYPKYSLLPILQTNRQLRAEFLDFLKLEKSKGNGIRYQVKLEPDVHRLDNLEPRWTVLPLPPVEPFGNVIRELAIDFKIPSFSELDCDGEWIDDGCYSTLKKIWFGGDAETFFRFLSDLLHHGPQGFFDPSLRARAIAGKDHDEYTTDRIGEGDAVLAVENMVVNIHFPELPVTVYFVNCASEHEYNEIYTREMKDFYRDRRLNIAGIFQDWLDYLATTHQLDGKVEKLELGPGTTGRGDWGKHSDSVKYVKQWSTTARKVEQSHKEEQLARLNISRWSEQFDSPCYRFRARPLLKKDDIRVYTEAEKQDIYWEKNIHGRVDYSD